MSKARLKKHLSLLTSDQLTDLLLELYEVRKEARDYLDHWCDPDESKTLDKAKTAIHRIFYIGADRPRRRYAASDITTQVKHFMTLGLDRTTIADFLLYVAETQCEWLEGRYRRLSHLSSMKKNLGAARIYIETGWADETPNPFALRLERLGLRCAGLWH